MSVEWDVSKLNKKLSKLAAHLSDVSRRALLKKMAVQVEGSLTDNLNSESNSRGFAWPGLAESTINRRRNKNKGAIKMLQDTGALRRWDHEVINSVSARIGTTVEYGEYHNYGPERFSVNFPKREWAYVAVKTERKLLLIIERHLKEGL